MENIINYNQLHVSQTITIGEAYSIIYHVLYHVSTAEDVVYALRRLHNVYQKKYPTAVSHWTYRSHTNYNARKAYRLFKQMLLFSCIETYMNISVH